MKVTKYARICGSASMVGSFTEKVDMEARSLAAGRSANGIPDRMGQSQLCRKCDFWIFHSLRLVSFTILFAIVASMSFTAGAIND